MRGNITAEELEKLDLEDLTAPCKFCQQYVSFKWNALTPITEEEKVEEATKNCNCDSALWYQERNTKINLASSKINELFETPEEASMRQIFLSATEKIIDRQVTKVTVVAGNGVKGDFSISQKDSIKIRRTEADITEVSL